MTKELNNTGMSVAGIKKAKKKSFLWTLDQNKWLLLMALPGIILTICFNYLPMFGIVIAFKNINYAKGIWGSDFIGFKNFEFLFRSPDMFIMIRNTLLYNLTFIALGLVLSVSLAIMLTEIKNKFLPKVYQTVIFMPYFFSWVVVGYFSFALFNSQYGFINKAILEPLGMAEIAWFTEPKYWPAIIVLFQIWKSIGYGTVVYVASIAGIDESLYEAAAIDGATKWQQTIHITVPSLMPIIIILTILNVGKIFNADFGLFFQTTLDQGALYQTTTVIDTYVYRALQVTGDIGMSSAAGFVQSVVGFVLVIGTNALVKKIDSDSSLF